MYILYELILIEVVFIMLRQKSEDKSNYYRIKYGCLDMSSLNRVINLNFD